LWARVQVMSLEQCESRQGWIQQLPVADAVTSPWSTFRIRRAILPING
jgi:hypothetical protein